MNREIEGSFLTRRGLRLIDKLLASKASLRLTRACAGDGVLGEDQRAGRNVNRDLLHFGDNDRQEQIGNVADRMFFRAYCIQHSRSTMTRTA